MRLPLALSAVLIFAGCAAPLPTDEQKVLGALLDRWQPREGYEIDQLDTTIAPIGTPSSELAAALQRAGVSHVASWELVEDFAYRNRAAASLPRVLPGMTGPHPIAQRNATDRVAQSVLERQGSAVTEKSAVASGLSRVGFDRTHKYALAYSGDRK